MTTQVLLERLSLDSTSEQNKQHAVASVLSSQRQDMNEVEMLEFVENNLLNRIADGDTSALFLLGQFYYEDEQYENAVKYFERAVSEDDWQAMYQLAVIYYDGLSGQLDLVKGFELMEKVANSSCPSANHLVRAAQYNLGRAYFQGYGVKQSYEQAERYWLLAADDGSPTGSLKAQTALGLYYSRDDSLDLKKAFFWHNEACGNGSLESQGSLGVMYLYGIGTKADMKSAFICLREATDRGNIYAAGHLVAYYYKRKLFTKAVELASKIVDLESVEAVSQKTDCIMTYIRKGIALACFYYARCLTDAKGVQQDTAEAKRLYSKSFSADADTCAELQKITQHGVI